jgi:glycerol-3-phosphate acyltransferase PlsY
VRSRWRIPFSSRRGGRLITALVGGYLLGTFPSARLASRIAMGGAVDLRASGSRNPGGLNARRLLGRPVGTAVVGADVAKGVLAGTWGLRTGGGHGAHVAAVASVAGHCYPVWSRGRGGKGVATSFGQCLVTFPVYAVLDVAVAAALTRLHVGRHPALVAGGGASAAWILAGVVWWRRALPNLWGPRPTAALPIANAVTTGLLASRALRSLRRGEPDELAPHR